jgi:hypothetical protein
LFNLRPPQNIEKTGERDDGRISDVRRLIETDNNFKTRLAFISFAVLCENLCRPLWLFK